jgi:hypothetical protein
MGFFLLAKVYLLNQLLKPLGFVLATGLHPLVSETASLLSECLRLRLTTNGDVPLAELLLGGGQVYCEISKSSRWRIIQLT